MKRRNSFYHIMAMAAVYLLISLVIGCSSTTSPNTGSSPGSGVNFNSGIVYPGGTFSYTFKNVGTYNYYCRIHKPDMKGQIIVSNNAQISVVDTVEMKNIQFVPNQVTVMPDTKIVWINRDNVDHTVISGSPS